MSVVPLITIMRMDIVGIKDRKIVAVSNPTRKHEALSLKEVMSMTIRANIVAEVKCETISAIRSILHGLGDKLLVMSSLRTLGL